MASLHFLPLPDRLSVHRGRVASRHKSAFKGYAPLATRARSVRYHPRIEHALQHTEGNLRKS